MNKAYPLVGRMCGDTDDPRAGQLGKIVVKELLIQSPRNQIAGCALTARKFLHDGSRRDSTFQTDLNHAEHLVRFLAFRRQRTE